MSDMEKTLGGRPVFAGDTPVRLANRVANLLLENWPALGAPHPAHEPALAEPNNPSRPIIILDQLETANAKIASEPSGACTLLITIHALAAFMPTEILHQTIKQLSGVWRWTARDDDYHQERRLIGLTASFDTSILTGVRAARLGTDIEQIRNLAEAIAPPEAATAGHDDLLKAYKKFAEVLEPIIPCPPEWADGAGPQAAEWAATTAELLISGLSPAIIAHTPLEQRFALALAADHIVRLGKSLGRFLPVTANTAKLIKLAADAPGYLALPPRCIRLQTNPYDMASEVESMLSALNAAGTPCLFFGAYSELQSTFSGGQGAEHSPLRPVICRMPPIPDDILMQFAVQQAAERAGLTSPALCQNICGELHKALEALSPANAKLILPAAAERAVAARVSGQTSGTLAGFSQNLAARSETFGGLSTLTRSGRRSDVQSNFLQRLTRPQLHQRFERHILGQSQAIQAAIARLREEVLTRPLHQPLRFALQGTPAVGKTDLLKRLAGYLDVPYIVIDAASMPDPHTASSQLLGSGRGIVGSFQAGRLEQVAKDHRGAVVEIADLDHAPDNVRSTLGDLFLQILENGEAQSATGTIFSCANLIIAFSLNLPGGKDERAYQRIGFSGPPTMADIRKDVNREIKNMVSGAFLSRIGEPILFEPLQPQTRLAIARNALESATRTALERLGYEVHAVHTPGDIAKTILQGLDAGAITFGARGVAETARSHACDAVLRFAQDVPPSQPVDVALYDAGNGCLEVRQQGPAKPSAPEN